MSISCEDLSVAFGDAQVLTAVDFAVGRGESVAVMGPSGTGKTTLLDCITGLRVPDSGRVVVNGAQVSALSRTARSDFRRTKVGLLFQSPELLDELTVVENVALLHVLSGTNRRQARVDAQDALELVGMAGHADKQVSQLSGGEAQRVGLARALAKQDIEIFVADEPTASLDPVNARSVAQLVIDRCRNRPMPLVMATHDERVAALCDRMVWLPDLLAPAVAC